MKDFRELVGYMYPMAVPGFVIGLVLAVGSPWLSGVSSAARDLYAAAVYVHPVLLALGGFVITGYFAIQNATVSRRVGKVFILPILSFFTQLFSGAVGLFFPLHFALNPALNCGNVVAAVITFFVLLGFAVAASATQILASRYERARSERTMGANGRDGEATENQALLFLLLAVACVVFIVISATITGSSEQLVKLVQLKASGLACY